MSAPKVCIQTYGCSFNAADGEAMAGLLARAGYELIDAPEGADAVILNTCTVKDRTYLNFKKRFVALREGSIRGDGPKLIVTGCIPKAYERAPWLEGVAMLGPDNIDDVPGIVTAALAGQTPRRVRADREAIRNRASLPVERRNPVVEILPIARGCLSACTFCHTKLARGGLVSFRPIDIVEQARRAVEDGVKELWLAAQDTGAYGRDLDLTLGGLLKQLCEIEGDHRIRLGMANPRWIHEDLDELLDSLEHPRMFKFLHVPVQSGSDRILAAMKRENTVTQYIELGEAFNRRFSEGTLLTDMIVGFPGETEEDFQASLDLIRRVQHVGVNRSKFSPRPGTIAAKMEQVPGEIVAERSRRMYEAVKTQAREYHEKLLGRRECVLTSECKKAGTTVAHNENYRPAILEGEWELGRWVEVEYAGFDDFHMKARPLTPTPPRQDHSAVKYDGAQ